MKTLLEDYQRRLKTVEQTIGDTTNTGSLNHIEKMTRLRTKASEYRTFMVEIQRAIEREKGEQVEDKTRLTKLTELSFADLNALREMCDIKMSYYQRRFPQDKKMHKNIYDEQYALWLEWYSLSNSVGYAIDLYITNLQAK